MRQNYIIQVQSLHIYIKPQDVICALKQVPQTSVTIKLQPVNV